MARCGRSATKPDATLPLSFLGSIGLFKPRARLVLVPAVMALLALHATGLLKHTTIAYEEIFGEIGKSVRLFGVYGAGMLFFLFRECIPLTGRGALVATLLLIPSLFSACLSEAAVTVFGGYILFWFALKVRVTWLRRFDGGPDISYGVYLYAWPIQSVLIYMLLRESLPLASARWRCRLAVAAGYASWFLVERPFLRPNTASFTELRELAQRRARAGVLSEDRGLGVPYPQRNRSIDFTASTSVPTTYSCSVTEISVSSGSRISVAAAFSVISSLPTLRPRRRPAGERCSG